MNTVGAAIGSLLAGFTLIPAVGISGATRIGMLASVLAAALVTIVVFRTRDEETLRAKAPVTAAGSKRGAGARQNKKGAQDTRPQPWLAIAVLGLSGFSALVHEIAWTRILALVLGPTTYAFAATIAAVVAGVAIGSGAGTWLVGRVRATAHAGWLALVLAAAA